MTDNTNQIPQELIDQLTEDFLDRLDVQEYITDRIYGYGMFPDKGEPMTEAQEELFCQLQVGMYHRILARVIAQL